MKLTDNFSKSEFECRDGSEMPEEVFNNVRKLAANLQVIREEIGKSIRINSGYRSPYYNKRIGGVSRSQHLLGTAADLDPAGMTAKELHTVILRLIEEGRIEEGGVGLYRTFCHYDIRKTKARWNG